VSTVRRVAAPEEVVQQVRVEGTEALRRLREGVEGAIYCTFSTVGSSIFCVTRKFKRDLVQNGQVEGIGVT
jgi:hypothetical protein